MRLPRVISDPTDTLVESAPHYAPPPLLSFNPSFATASTAPAFVAFTGNLAAMQTVAGEANAPPLVLLVFTNQSWNPGDLAEGGM